MFTILVNIIIATTFHLSMLICRKDMCGYFEIPCKSRNLKISWRPFSQGFRTCKGMWMQQKIISFCNFTARELECLVCCPVVYDKLCVVHWLLSKCRKYIIVETNHEAFYKMKLQNEWDTFIELKILPVSYLFYAMSSPIFGGMAECMEYCKIRNIRNTLKHGIYTIFYIWLELDWQKIRGKEYSVVLK